MRGLTPEQQFKADLLWDSIMLQPRELYETFPVSARHVHFLLESPINFNKWWRQNGKPHGKEGRDFKREGDDWKVSLNIAATLWMGGQTTPVAMYLTSRMAQALADMGRCPVEMIESAQKWGEENERLEKMFGEAS